eukprot:scaffold3909_cov117-Isochrysis_galbana.AAC.3
MAIQEATPWKKGVEPLGRRASPEVGEGVGVRGGCVREPVEGRRGPGMTWDLGPGCGIHIVERCEFVCGVVFRDVL